MLDLGSLLYVPQPEHPIPAAAGQHLATGMERDHQAIVTVALERDRRLAGVDVPDPDRVVLEAGRQEIRFSGFQARWKTSAGLMRLVTTPASESLARTTDRAAGPARECQTRAVAIESHRVGLAEALSPAPPLASIDEIDHDDRSIAPPIGELPPIGMECPARRQAPR